MRIINKKMVVVVLLIIEFTCGYLMYQSSKKEVDLAKVRYEEEIKDSMFAMYVENEDTGEYDEVTNTNTFPEGYILNTDKTGCIDNKGNSINDILTSKDDKVMVKSNKTVFCYLYFDKDNRVYTQVKRDYKNNTGALLLSETESDEYPVYYYNGNIINNNILYANFCWKMVRTTETGGVKLIYNGVPDETEDGTLTCDNTGEESQIGTSAFNSSNTSLAHVGYMYNTIYNMTSKSLMLSQGIIESRWTNDEPTYNTYYYGNTATWDETEGVYKLSNSDGSEVIRYTWKDNYSDLKGYYTCLSVNGWPVAQCETVYYVIGGSFGSSSGNIICYGLSNNTTKDDQKVKLATSVTDNDDGTYTLVDPIEVKKEDWYTNYANYNKYYICNDLISETCEEMMYITSTTSLSFSGYNMENVYKYGNSAKYENGVYTLVDIKEFWNWPENYNNLNNNHYTCFNTSGECEQVYYIYYANNSYAYYITLGDGKTVEMALNEMLYANDVNATDSTIKAYIDAWYESNIVGKKNLNEILYSKYLEDTIWCNNREVTNLGGWNPNGGSTSSYLTFNHNSFKCKNKIDQFTLKVENGGTEGYGNNSLNYPVGLLAYKEVSLASPKGYLNFGMNSWVMSPSGLGNEISIYRLQSNGSLQGARITLSYSVRPSLSLSNKVEITSGNGEVDNPYQVILSN